MTEHNQASRSEYTPQPAEQEPRSDALSAQDGGDNTEFLEQLAGSNTAGTTYIDAADVEQLAGITMTNVYQGDTDTNQERGDGDAERFDLLVERELREGETDDMMEAVEEGLTYVPPIDPPLSFSQDDRESVEIANGTALSADDLDSDGGDLDTAHMAEDDMRALVRRSLRDDSATSHLADRLDIVVINGTVIVRGEVDDLDDTDNIVAVISEVPGVEAVRDQTEVRGL